jgi:hypothetical protein
MTDEPYIDTVRTLLDTLRQLWLDHQEDKEPPHRSSSTASSLLPPSSMERIAAEDHAK